MTDQELLQCLNRFPDGQPITLYHVDSTGNVLKGMESSGGRIYLRSGEFWFTTNVEARTGFKGGAGLDTIVAFKVDRRFVLLLGDLAQDQRTGALAEKGMKLFFNADLAVPRVNFEGGGGGKLPAADVNIAIRMTKAAPEFERLFQLSIRRADHVSHDSSRPPGTRLVHVKVLYPAGGGATGKGGGSSSAPLGPPRRGTPPVGRLGGAVRVIGGSLVLLGVNLLLGYIGNVLRQKVEAQVIEKAMKGLEPEIDKRVRNQAVNVADIQAGGRKAFAVVTVITERWTTMDLVGEGGRPGPSVESAPSIGLSRVAIEADLDKKEKGQGKEGKYYTKHFAYHSIDYFPYTYWFEVALPKELVDTYRTLNEELLWYEDQVTRNPNLPPEDLTRLSQDKMKLEKKIHEWTHPQTDDYSNISPPVVSKLAVPSTTTNTQDLTGWWWVSVDQFYWCYVFEPTGSVRWSDPYNHRSGQGKWKKVQGGVEVAWSPPSTAKERWDARFGASRLSGSYYHAPNRRSDLNAERISDESVKKLVGRWQVREANAGFWTWEYMFGADGTVTWRDQFNGKRGSGRWSFTKTSIYIDWSATGSPTREEWSLPIGLMKQKGMCRTPGKAQLAITADKV